MRRIFIINFHKHYKNKFSQGIFFIATIIFSHLANCVPFASGISFSIARKIFRGVKISNLHCRPRVFSFFHSTIRLPPGDWEDPFDRVIN